MSTRAKMVLVLAVFVVGGVLAATSAQGVFGRRLGSRARLSLVERHFADLNVNHGSLEAQVHALAARVAALEARLEQCGCLPPCMPCQEQGLCGPGGEACGADTDGDGIDDCPDRCPCEPGDAEHAGCPPPPPPPCDVCICPEVGASCGHDADGDGTDDCLDLCPCEPGPAEETGCPAHICRVCETCQIVPCGHDADGDGLDDCQDTCPCRPGPADHEGCPTGEACQSDADCDDSNGCSLDACVDGICRHECLCVGPEGFDCCPGPVGSCPPTP